MRVKLDIRLLIIASIIILAGCSESAVLKLSTHWTTTLATLGTYSSIRCADLNGDDTLDIILGAGHNEYEVSDSAVVAINGADGKLLWSHPGEDQMVGTAVIADMNLDNSPDVIIGGRKAQFKVIDGTNGKEIWSFQIKHNDHDAKGYMRFNFFSPQILEDLTDDNIPELLVANGGNIRAYKSDGSDRFPGVIGILDGSTGDIIAVDTMPDGQETYMSPVLFERGGEQMIIYGSGGETMSGHLYTTSLANLLNNDISGSIQLARREGHGFIAPVTLADITQDGQLDIIANWHGGEMMAFDGTDLQKLWSHSLVNTELNSPPTPGDVTGDNVPDFFSSYTIGAWPKSIGSIQVILDGTNGHVIHSDTSGCVGFSSGISHDITNDGRAEFLYTINDHDCTGFYRGDTRFSFRYYSHADQKEHILYPDRLAKNIASTPWIGDLDGDKHLDLIICLQGNFNDIYSYYGLQISRLNVNGAPSTQPSWSQYMGDGGRGVYLNSNAQ